MACVTLKRPLEFDPLHHSPGAASSCSPRPHKRRRCLPMCIPASQVSTQHTSPLSASSFAPLPHTLHSAGASPFVGAASELRQDDIAQYVREEIRRLKRRRLLHAPPRLSTDSRSTMDVEGGEDSSSPSQSPQRTTSPALTALLPSSSPNSNKDKQIFTFKQVVHLCSQLLRERDSKVREEYERVLIQRKAEQYDCFVRFTADQLQPAQPQQQRPTYLS